jgi:hypothetical protein
LENWQKPSELLDRQGWECTYARFVDLEAQEEFYWVSISRGEKNLTSLWSTLEEAAMKVSRFVASVAA